VSETRNRSRRCCHCQRLMNDIYKPGGNLAKNPRWLPTSRRIAGESCDYIPVSPRSRRRHPRWHASGALSLPVIVVRPRRIADGTLFQEPSGVSWIVLEHLPDVRKSCHSSGNCKPPSSRRPAIILAIILAFC